MGKKTVKWQNGQEMLVKCVMDTELYDLIDENRMIGGHHFTQQFTDREGNNVRLAAYWCCMHHHD